MKYRISRRADKDVEHICDYIAQDNPSAADRIDHHLHQSIQSLVEFPGSGHSRPDVTNPRYRFWSVGNYVIAYRIERNVLIVIRILHGARDFRGLFKRKRRGAE